MGRCNRHLAHSARNSSECFRDGHRGSCRSDCECSFLWSALGLSSVMQTCGRHGFARGTMYWVISRCCWLRSACSGPAQVGPTSLWRRSCHCLQFKGLWWWSGKPAESCGLADWRRLNNLAAELSGYLPSLRNAPLASISALNGLQLSAIALRSRASDPRASNCRPRWEAKVWCWRAIQAL